LPANVVRPALRLSRGAQREARAMCRSLARGGPLVVLAPARGWPVPSFARAFARLRRRIGARGVVLGRAAIDGATNLPRIDPAVGAALLALAAVCIGDDAGWAHVAAAVGAPTVTLHGKTSPLYSGPATRHGAALFTTRGACEACAPGKRCLSCLDPDRVADVAEDLSARRWPLDRVMRLLP
jgi:ADP-heptose:LPS heptosyltransferase